MYAGNAAVIEAGLPTDNGYLYVLDEVYEPLRTLYEAIEEPKADDFSVFLKLYDKFAEPTVASTTAGDTLYHYYHLRRTNKSVALNATDMLPSIASQWTYHGEMNNLRPDWPEYGRWCYNCFAPNNTAFERFLVNILVDFPVLRMCLNCLFII
ncbi:MAG: hypothetical protein LIO65_02570 [Odoribacter sp.]|nr:hypothetical protein [Odoribacter sp.]